MALKQYVCFLTPGSMFPNEKWEPILSRKQEISAPKNCFAYYFFDREEVEQDGELLVGKIKNKSGRYYFGEIMTAEQVEKSVPDNSILLSNIRINKWDRLVRTKMGNFQPLEKNDTVLS